MEVFVSTWKITLLELKKEIKSAYSGPGYKKKIQIFHTIAPNSSCPKGNSPPQIQPSQ